MERGLFISGHGLSAQPYSRQPCMEIQNKERTKKFLDGLWANLQHALLSECIAKKCTNA